jgi:hypothetical protein
MFWVLIGGCGFPWFSVNLIFFFFFLGHFGVSGSPSTGWLMTLCYFFGNCFAVVEFLSWLAVSYLVYLM